jgi:hypothetical protein
VRQRKHKQWPAELLTVLVLVTSFAVLRPNVIRHILPEPATRFLAYYQAARNTSVKDRLWERITYSLLLSAGDTKTGQTETRR